MIDYSTIANTSGSFPSVVAADASGGGATDGTPLLAAVLDDLWGFNQHLINIAGMTPDGVTESSTASQKIEALQRVCGHPGEIVGWAGPLAIDPNTLNIRLLPCIGQTVSVSLYGDLVDATYVGNAYNSAAFAAGGGFVKTDVTGVTPSTSGTHLLLPDLRGQFLRGVDTPGAVDPDGATRYLAEVQNDDVTDHSHYVEDTTAALGSPGMSTSALYVYTANPGTAVLADIAAFVDPIDSGTARAGDVVGSLGVESRPVNMSVKWCVRY